MADITWADVTAAFPNDTALAAVTEPAAAGPLAVANNLAASSFGADTYTYARVLVAAHYASRGNGGGGSAPAGPLVSESADNISRSYAASAVGGSSDWSTTSYGQLYAALVRTSRARLPRPRICE
jgi:hypothetical protein